jgi:hypothetical protein
MSGFHRNPRAYKVGSRSLLAFTKFRLKFQTTFTLPIALYLERSPLVLLLKQALWAERFRDRSRRQPLCQWFFLRQRERGSTPFR